MKGLLGVAAGVLLLAGATAAKADTMQYTFQGIGTGTLGSTSFTEASFTITVLADRQLITAGGGIFSVNSTLATISIAGFSVTTFVTATRVFSNEKLSVAGFSRAGRRGQDLVDIANAAFATYNLTTSFGPVFVAVPFAVYQFQNVATTAGLLSFSSIRDVTFQAVRLGKTMIPGRPLMPVPEPGTLTLVALGALGMGVFRRRFSARRR